MSKVLGIASGAYFEITGHFVTIAIEIQSDAPVVFSINA